MHGGITMKKFIVLLMLFALGLSCAGCKNANSTTESSQSEGEYRWSWHTEW